MSAARRFRRRRRIGIIGNAPGGNYRVALLKLIAETEIAPGSIGRVGIYHDDDCCIFHGRACDCSPDIRMAWRSR
jgi:hypothetical protein